MRNSKRGHVPIGQKGEEVGEALEILFQNGGNWNSTGPRLAPGSPRSIQESTESAALSALRRRMS